MNRQFIPVALKAGLVNNPPTGLEGALYTEIGRSRPAPQGICVANSSAKVLSWVLMFDDDESVDQFLDHALARYADFPDARTSVPAQRFMRYPGHQLPEVADTGTSLSIPPGHQDDRCPGSTEPAPGILRGRIIGRALDDKGQPVTDVIRQEHYMEARFDLTLDVQRELVEALRSTEQRQRAPESFARSLAGHAYLGQLDVAPLGDAPGGHNERASWQFWLARPAAGEASSAGLFHLEGRSVISGRHGQSKFRDDGRRWEHTVNLTWEGYVRVDFARERIEQLMIIARGEERLRWGHNRPKLPDKADVRSLPSGHAIDLNGDVIYGLVAPVDD